MKGSSNRGTHFLRDWNDECRVERNIEPPSNSGLASTLHIYCHTGTHIDSAFQDDPKGKGLWETPVEDFCAYAVTLDVSFMDEGTELTAEELKKAEGVNKIEKGDWIFLTSDHLAYMGPRIDKDAAQWLIDRGIRGFGESRSVSYERICHKLFHLNDLLIIDSLDQAALLSVAGKRLWTISFPLAIKYLEASPCRVVAFEE
ncbi:cyclase family protein [Thermoproteota archaeon]